VPDLLHIVPVGDDAVLNRVLERQDAALRLRLVADVRVLLAMPTITPVWRGRPTIDGNTARGASSPAKPLILMKERRENQEKKKKK
jgi:hypothetical protein